MTSSSSSKLQASRVFSRVWGLGGCVVLVWEVVLVWSGGGEGRGVVWCCGM